LATLPHLVLVTAGFLLVIAGQMLYPIHPCAFAHRPGHAFFVAIFDVQHILLAALYSARLQRLSAAHAFLHLARVPLFQHLKL